MEIDQFRKARVRMFQGEPITVELLHEIAQEYVEEEIYHKKQGVDILGGDGRGARLGLENLLMDVAKHARKQTALAFCDVILGKLDEARGVSDRWEIPKKSGGGQPDQEGLSGEL